MSQFFLTRATTTVRFFLVSIQKAFLTGTLQNFARRMKFAIDTVQFNFVIVDTPWEELAQRPQVTFLPINDATQHIDSPWCIFFRNTTARSYIVDLFV